MTLEKKSGIKVHLGVDILGLPHAIMLTTAEVTDRNGAIEMVEYYCDVTDNLAKQKRCSQTVGILGQLLQTLSSSFLKWK